MFILKMRPHGNLSLESAIAYWTVVRQCFRVGGKVFGQMILSEKSLLADTTLVRFDASVAHLKINIVVKKRGKIDNTSLIGLLCWENVIKCTLCRRMLAPLENFMLHTSHSNIFLWERCPEWPSSPSPSFSLLSIPSTLSPPSPPARHWS